MIACEEAKNVASRDARWNVVTSLALLGVVAAILVGLRPAEPASLTGRELTLIDGEGNTRARLAVIDNRGPCLQLLDKTGGVRAEFFLNEGSSEQGDDGVSTGIRLTGANQNDGIVLAAGSNVRMIALHDLVGQSRVSMKVGQYGAPVLTRSTLSFDDSLVLGVSPMGIPRPERRDGQLLGPAAQVPMPILTLGSSKGTQIQLQVWGDGEPSVDVWGQSGASLLSIPSSTAGSDVDAGESSIP